jgi:uncharacterized membrane protein
MFYALKSDSRLIAKETVLCENCYKSEENRLYAREMASQNYDVDTNGTFALYGDLCIIPVVCCACGTDMPYREIKKKIQLEIEVTPEEFSAFLVNCRINAGRVISVNNTNLQPVYQQILKQLEEFLTKTHYSTYAEWSHINKLLPQ